MSAPVPVKRDLDPTPFYVGVRAALLTNRVVVAKGAPIVMVTEVTGNVFPYISMSITSLTDPHSTYTSTIGDCRMDVQAVDAIASDDAEALGAAIGDTLLDQEPTALVIPGWELLAIRYVTGISRTTLDVDRVFYYAGRTVMITARRLP